MSTFRLTIAYDGTDYAGWQRQAGVDTVQARLEAALREVEGAPVTVHGAGRTDAGVHALGQVASVRLEQGIDAAALARALNATLPEDIRVLQANVAPDQFHARFDASGKTYRYRLLSVAVADPFEARYAWQIRRSLDVPAMQQASARLCGTHDFAAFQTAASEGVTKSTVRTISKLDVTSSPCDDAHLESGQEATRLTIEVDGDGFLRHMVRTIVGTIVEVGLGRWTPDTVEAVLASRSRSQAGPTAPAHGLYLVRVRYHQA